MKNFLLSIVFLFCLANISYSQAKKNLLPSMGFSAWYISHCKPTMDSQWDEAYYKKLVDYFVQSGLQKLGYQFIILECNDHHRDTITGEWIANEKLFPNKYKGIVDYAHANGMKLKAYTDAGKSKCCCNNAGSYGYYESDAKTWAEIGFDGVKIDWCGGYNEKLDPKTQYIKFYEAIKKHIKTPFDIEICCWGRGKPWNWGQYAGTYWRTAMDIDLVFKAGTDSIFENDDNFPADMNLDDERNKSMGGKWDALLRNIKNNRHPDPALVGPTKGYNYPDILLVGLAGGLNETEERTQFSMWAIMASPLYIGCNVAQMPEYAKKILMNKDVIAIDQDPLGIQGDVISENKETQVWAKPLNDGSCAIAMFNKGETNEIITINFSDIKMPKKSNVKNIWEDKYFKSVKNSFHANVKPHETVLLKISK